MSNSEISLSRKLPAMMVTTPNVFVHSNPPKAISGGQGAQKLRNWVRSGDLEKLEGVILEGQGARLLGLIDTTNDPKTKAFLKAIPTYMAKVDLIHDAVSRGSLRETQALLDKRKLATARDAVGRSIAHKAVLQNNKTVLEWLAKKFPEVCHLKDNEGRSPLHYTAAAPTSSSHDLYNFLLSLGCSPEAVDLHGKKPLFYLQHPEELDIEGGNSRRGRLPSQTGRKTSPTRAQIRIWIHEKDIGKLENIVWSGHGDKLLLETTNNSRVRRFLDNVPHLLSCIKQVHAAAVNNDLAALKELKEKVGSVVGEVFKAKDGYGLTPLHKAVGLGNREVVEYLLYEWPELKEETDAEGRGVGAYSKTEGMSRLLGLSPGAGERRVEVEGRYLRNVPDAPRVTGEMSGWDRSDSPMSLGKRKGSDEWGGSGSGSGPGGSSGAANHLRSGGGGKVRRKSSEEREWMEAEEIETAAAEVAKSAAAAASATATGAKSAAASMSTTASASTEKGEQMWVKDVGDGYVVDGVEEETTETAAVSKYELNPDVPLFRDEEELRELVGGGEEDEEEEELRGMKRDDEAEAETELAAAAALMNGDVVDLAEGKEDEAMDMFDDNENSAPPQKQQRAGSNIKSRQATPNVASRSPRTRPTTQHKSPLLHSPSHSRRRSSQPPAAATPAPSGGHSRSVSKSSHPVQGTEGVGMDSVPPTFSRYAAPPPPNVPLLIQTCNMEALVDLVLEGQGHLLLHQTSNNPEVSEFLNNVPAYMAKIASIHTAAGTNQLRDLESLLDRKRLSEAKDSEGRVPLHLAVLGGHPNIVRYFCQHYPQCIDSVDKAGRSPLHYAATLGDGGVLYKLLLEGGASPSLKDRDGLTPADVLGGAVVGAGDHHSHSASSVDKWERPSTPALAPLALNSASASTSQKNLLLRRRPFAEQSTDEIDPAQLELLESFYLEISRDESLWAKTWKKLTKRSSNVAKEYVGRYLTREVFDLLKTRSTPRYHTTLLDCIKFYPQFFLVAPDPHSYSSFRELFTPAVREHNGVLYWDGSSCFDEAEMKATESIPVVDVPSKFIKQVRIRLSRNLRPYPFISILSKSGLEEIAKKLEGALRHLNYMKVTIESLEKEEREELVQSRDLILMEASKISRFWPKQRYVYISEDSTEQIWVNGQDHLDFYVTGVYGKVGPLLRKMKTLYDKVDLDYHFNSEFGYLTVDPFRCGTGMKITTRLRVPHLMKSRGPLNKLCVAKKLYIKWSRNYDSKEIDPEDYIEIENVTTYGFNEIEIGKEYAEAVAEVVKEEERLGREADLLVTGKKK